MRLWSSAFLVVSLASFAHGQNFLSGLFNMFHRFNPFRPQQSSRPSPVFRPNNRFRPRPNFQVPLRTPALVRDPQPVRQQITPFQPSESFRSQPAPAPQFQSFQAPSVSTQIVQSAQIQSVQRIPPPASGRGNHVFQGRSYFLSWKEGQNHFSWSQARNYCSGKGMRIVSLDSTAKKEHFLQLVQSEGVTFMWAGGQISSDKRTLTWENGSRETIARGSHPWSFAGLRGPQPDGQGSEDCLALLNNLYNDGVKFHDVGCSHDKSTVCEA